MGDELQGFLLAHGYLIQTPALPFRNNERRRKSLSQWLEKNQKNNFHFVLSQMTWNEFKNELIILEHSTFTIIGENFKASDKPKWHTPVSYRLHQLFCFLNGYQNEPYEHTLPSDSIGFYNQFLDHFINLAENEYTGDFDESNAE